MLITAYSMKRDIFDKDKSNKAKRRCLFLAMAAALLFTFSVASAETTLILKVDQAPETLPLGDVILMNPGDMEDLGLSGGERGEQRRVRHAVRCPGPHPDSAVRAVRRRCRLRRT